MTLQGGSVKRRPYELASHTDALQSRDTDRCSMLDVRRSFMIPTSQILGIQFFNGNVEEVVRLMFQQSGLLVAPSGTCFARLREDEQYRRALVSADLAIADSGLMVVLWRL